MRPLGCCAANYRPPFFLSHYDCPNRSKNTSPVLVHLHLNCSSGCTKTNINQKKEGKKGEKNIGGFWPSN